LYAAENALVRSTQTVSTNLVALYKALGGGTGDTVSHETGSDISR
jgi:outer membrane protein TolC